MSDHQDDRAAILARRAVLITAALASINEACGRCLTPQPQPCLSPVYVPPEDAGIDGSSEATDAGAPPIVDAGEIPVPQPCLSPVYIPPDAGRPMPCLSVAPHPCLSVKRPVK